MENGLILIVIIIAVLLGRKSWLLGALVCVIGTIVIYFIFNPFTLKSFIAMFFIGVFLGIGTLIISQIILPGLKGGKHNTGPSYIGGGDRQSGSRGGIVPTDDELKTIKENQRKIS